MNRRGHLSGASSPRLNQFGRLLLATRVIEEGWTSPWRPRPLDRPSGLPVRRYEASHPGALVHQDHKGRLYTSNEARLAALPGSVDFYNQRRPHSSLGGLSPSVVVNNVRGDHT